MIRLYLLRSPEIVASDGRPIRGVLSQPKRTALLVYLTTAGRGGFLSRDTLLAMLWPESPEARARHALSQSLYALRHGLGEGVIVKRGQNEVGIDRDLLWCDAVAFHEAIREEDWQAAVGLYHSDLLEGFHLREAYGFVDWLDRERDRLRRAMARASLHASEQLALTSDVEASAMAHRAVGFLDGDEAGLRRALQVLDSVGDRAGALAVYARLVERLRENHGSRPSPETEAMVDAIRDRAEAVVREATTPGRAPPDRVRKAGTSTTVGAPGSPSLVGAPTEGGKRTARHGKAAATVAVLIMSAATGVWTTRLASDDAGRQGRFAVWPFSVTTEDERLDWLSTGAQSMLGGSLDIWSETEVADPQQLLAVGAQRGTEVEPSTLLPEALGTARDARSGTLIRGSIVAHAGTVQVVLRLYDTDSGQLLRDPIRAEGPADEDLRPLFDRLAATVLDLQDMSTVGPDLRAATTRSLEAYRHYLTGHESFRALDMNRAAHELRAAAEADTTFALAHYELARALIARAEDHEPSIELARRFLDRALRHAGRLPDQKRGHLMAFHAFAGGNYGLARELYEGLLDSDSLDAAAWHYLGEVEYHDDRTIYRPDGEPYPRGGWQRALRAFQRSVELDPSFPMGYEHTIDILAVLNGSNFWPRLRPEERASLEQLGSADSLIYFYAAYEDSAFWVRVEPPPVSEVRTRYQNDSLRHFLTDSAISVARRWTGVSHRSPSPHYRLAWLYTQVSEYALALDAAKRMAAVYGEAYGDTTTTMREILAVHYAGAGVYDTAGKIVDGLMDRVEAGRGPGEPMRPVSGASNVYMARGRPVEASERIFNLVGELPPMSRWMATPEGGIDQSRTWHLYQNLLALAATGADRSAVVPAFDGLVARWQEQHTPAEVAVLKRNRTISLVGALLQLDDQRLDRWLNTAAPPEDATARARLQPSAWQAIRHLRAGDTAAAALAYDRATADLQGHAEMLRPGTWYLMATVAQELGRDEQAVELFREVRRSLTWMAFVAERSDWGYVSLSHLHEARSLERLGQRALALAEYEHFIDAWSDSEPELRHYLEQAQAGARRLRAPG